MRVDVFRRVAPRDLKSRRIVRVRGQHVAADAVTPVHADGGRDRTIAVEPEGLLPRVGMLVATPPPLQVRGFPDARRRVRLPRGVQEGRHEREILETAGVMLAKRDHLATIGFSG